jgi:hypothetical protein
MPASFSIIDGLIPGADPPKNRVRRHDTHQVIVMQRQPGGWLRSRSNSRHALGAKSKVGFAPYASQSTDRQP